MASTRMLRMARCEARSPQEKLTEFRKRLLNPAKDSKQWYARHLMWAYASEEVPGLEYLNEVDARGQFVLTDEVYERCLKRLQEDVDKHIGRAGQKYERGAGVRTRDDRVDREAYGNERRGRYGTEREQYNGRGGGRVFKWYSRAVFNNYLARMGASEQSCSERQCMVALAAVSDELRKYPMVLERLTPFAGPQCYPHLDPRSASYRVHANERRRDGEAEEGEGGAAREGAEPRAEACAVLDEGCWLRCDRCSKWRCVAAACAPALRGYGFFDVRATDMDWSAWLGGARRRYAMVEAAAGGAKEEGV